MQRQKVERRQDIVGCRVPEKFSNSRSGRPRDKTIIANAFLRQPMAARPGGERKPGQASTVQGSPRVSGQACVPVTIVQVGAPGHCWRAGTHHGRRSHATQAGHRAPNTLHGFLLRRPDILGLTPRTSDGRAQSKPRGQYSDRPSTYWLRCAVMTTEDGLFTDRALHGERATRIRRGGGVAQAI